MKLVAVFCLLVLLSNGEARKLQARSKGSQRIIGGDQANSTQFPFMAAIYKTTDDGTFLYGGTLITNQWILSSASSLQDGQFFTIILGTNSLSGTDPGTLRLTANETFTHPDYNPNTVENDIGLIKLRSPVEITQSVKPIHVLASIILPDSAAVSALGWGEQSEDSVNVDALNYVSLVTLSNEECALTYGDVIKDNMVCAQGLSDEGICVGDFGSPLIQVGGGDLVYHLGVASFISTRGCESGEPSGFTRTAPYVDWLNEVVSQNP